MIVYLVTNLVNGKKYIGQTVRTLKERWYQHTLVNSSKCTVMRNAIKKYGIESFKVETLNVCLSKEAMNSVEKFYVKNLNTMVPKGYNRTEGGDGMAGYNISGETRRRMSVVKKGKRLSPGTEFKKGIRPSIATEFKRGERVSPKTEFKPGFVSWNTGTAKNVYYTKSNSKWAVIFTVNGKLQNFGTYNTKEVAEKWASCTKRILSEDLATRAGVHNA